IIVTKTPGIDTSLALQIARMVSAVRKEYLRKVPGVAETLDWAATLAGLGAHDLRQEPESVYETIICLLNTHEDRVRLTQEERERLFGTVAEGRVGRSSPSHARPLKKSVGRCAKGLRALRASCAKTDSTSGSRKRVMRSRSSRIPLHRDRPH